MTIKEAENFYKQDKKEYILTTKSIIKNWINDVIEIEKIRLKDVKYPENYGYALKNSIKTIYDTIQEIKELQELIDFLTIWYEIKYPNKEMDRCTIYLAYKNIKPLSKQMDIEQLLYRLNNKHEDLMLCYYRARGWSAVPVIINNKIVNDNSIVVTLKIKKEINNLNDDYFISLNIDYKTGYLAIDKWLEKEICECIDKKHIEKGYIHIEELLKGLENSNNKVEYITLLESVIDRKIRLKIRKEILELTALKILYSENTIPEYGYERAKRFINEMNKKLNANLTTDKIDEIMSKDYSTIKKLIK